VLGQTGRPIPHVVRRVSWLSLGLLAIVAVVLLVRADGPAEPPLADPLPANLRALADDGPLRVGWARDVAPISIWNGDTPDGGYGVELRNLMAIKVGLELEHVASTTTPLSCRPSVTAQSTSPGRTELARTSESSPCRPSR